MNLLLVLAGMAIIAAINLPGLIKNRQWHDLTVYTVIFLLVLTLAVLMAVGVRLPSPIKAAQKFYQDVLHLSFKKS